MRGHRRATASADASELRRAPIHARGVQPLATPGTEQGLSEVAVCRGVTPTTPISLSVMLTLARLSYRRPRDTRPQR